MSDVVKAIIFLILVVGGVPVFFCVGYIVSVCAARAFDAALDALGAFADVAYAAGERLVEAIDKAVFRK